MSLILLMLMESLRKVLTVYQSAVRNLWPLLGVVDELLRKMLTLLPVRRPHLWPLLDAALHSGQIPKLRLQPWQAANKLELDKTTPLRLKSWVNLQK